MDTKEELERARNDALYLGSHREEYLARYPDRWVAIIDEELVAAAEQLADLLSQIDERGVSRKRVFIEYLSTRDDVLILPSS